MMTHVQEAIATVELGTLRDTYIEPDPNGTIRFEEVFHDGNPGRHDHTIDRRRTT